MALLRHLGGLAQRLPRLSASACSLQARRASSLSSWMAVADGREGQHRSDLKKSLDASLTSPGFVNARFMAKKFVRKIRNVNKPTPVEITLPDLSSAKLNHEGHSVKIAVILERLPIIRQEPSEMEKKWSELQEQLEAEKTLLAPVEVDELDGRAVSPPDTLPPDFVPGPRVTEDDRQNNHKSLNRKLDQSLFLLVKKNRKSNAWQFPQGERLPPEYLRYSADRIARQALGSKLSVHCPTFSPVAFLQYKYSTSAAAREPEPPSTAPKSPVGAKVFFYPFHLIQGELNLNARKYVDHAWVTKDELKEYVSPEYFDAVKAVLI